MPEIIQITLLPGIGLTLLLFGFAPPFVLRLILQLYPRNDPRRAELMAELRARPWRDRPMWIAEQLETGLSEGLPHRVQEVRRQRRLRRSSRLRHRRGSAAVRKVHTGNTVTYYTIEAAVRDLSTDDPGGMIELQKQVTRTVGVDMQLKWRTNPGAKPK